MYERSVSYQYVGNVSIGAGTTVHDMPNGSIAAVELDGAVIVASIPASANPNRPFRFAQKMADGQIIYSPEVTFLRMLIQGPVDYVDPTEQITVFGNANTTGLGTIVAGETYTISAVLNYSQMAVNNTPFIKTIPYKATGTTQQEVATGIALAATNILKRNMPTEVMAVERLVDAAAIAAGAVFSATAVATHITVTNGSTEVFYSAAGVPAVDGTTGLVAGDVITINDVAYVVATNDDAASFTIDQPYQGATENVLFANAISLNGVAITGWALQFRGIEQPFNPVTDMYHKVRFTLTSNGFDPAVVAVNTQEAFEGNGTYQQVAQKEIYAAMNDGKPFIQAYPPTNYRLEANPAFTYDIINIVAWHDTATFPGSGTRPLSIFAIDLAIEENLVYDNLGVVLDIP